MQRLPEGQFSSELHSTDPAARSVSRQLVPSDTVTHTHESEVPHADETPVSQLNPVPQFGVGAAEVVVVVLEVVVLVHKNDQPLFWIQ